MSLGVAQCNIKIRLLYIDNGLEILFSSPILVWPLVPVSDWHTQRSLTTPGRPFSPSGVTRRNSCDCCRSRKRFYFTWNLSRNGNKTKFLRNRPFCTLQSQLKLVLFRSAFALKFQLQFQQVTTASVTFFGPPFLFKICPVSSLFPSRLFLMLYSSFVAQLNHLEQKRAARFLHFKERCFSNCAVVVACLTIVMHIISTLLHLGRALNLMYDWKELKPWP